MKCYKYKIEGYEDFMHRMGYFKQYKIFIPSPYNFCICIWKDKIHYMRRQEEVDNFDNNMFGFNPDINEIEIDKENTLKCLKIMIEEGTIDKEKIIEDKNFEKYKDDILSI